MNDNPNAITFPDLEPLLYRSMTMYELIDEYIEELKKNGSFPCMMYANKLTAFKVASTNPQVLQQLEEDFVEMKGILSQWRKDSKTKFSVSIFKRRKNFIGMNEKIRLFLKKGNNLDMLNDTLGFRIIIGNGKYDTEDSITACYQILTKITEFFVNEKGCIPCELDSVPTSTKFNVNESINNRIIVPAENMIPEELRRSVKNYILYPKENGYQSLHIVFKTVTEIKFEVQIRTQAMHLHAEYGIAEHSSYKKTRYADSDEKITFDKEKVQILGYVALKSENSDGTQREVVHDLVGLDTSIDQFNLLIG